MNPWMKVIGMLVLLVGRSVAAEQANVIIIVADDLGYGELGSYGGTDVPTPQIDSLARNGVRFTSAATLGATAVSQAQLFEGFFAALEPRVSSVRFVNVTRLHDWTPLECARFAEIQKLAVDDPEVLFECASGLRDGADGAKLSWQAFLKASAAYAPP